MGAIYINPAKESAQKFLAREGKFFVETPCWSDGKEDHLFACIAIVNEREIGVVCKNYQEFEEWARVGLSDSRYWYLISIEKLSAATGKDPSFFTS